VRYALIDNSTLTAMQRILGEIPINNKYLIDGDILCLESYLQAILLYDQLVFLDDYKEQYRASRKACFDKMLGFRPSAIGYNALIAKAKEVTEDIVLCVEGGKIKGRDFAPFFELLKMNVTFTWDLSSSVYYLTEKMLEDVGGLDLPKYSKLVSMIYVELLEKRGTKEEGAGPRVLLYDSKGNPIDSDYTVRDKEGRVREADISKQVKAFFAGLNWLAFRTVVYTLTAKEFGVDLFLHPIRNAFQINLLCKLHVGNPAIFKPIILAMNGIVSETINKVMGATQPFVVQQPLPMFTIWLAEKTGNPHRFIEAAYELRNDKAFVQARQQLIELEDMLSEGDHASFVKEANKLIRDVQKQMGAICAKFGVDTPQGIHLSPLISVWNFSTLATGLPQVPELNVDIKALAFVRDILPARGFKAVYRTLLQDLTQIARLGKYYDIIASKVVLAEGANYYDSKVERAKYSRFKSWWKIPM
jgi:hypothetical protein